MTAGERAVERAVGRTRPTLALLGRAGPGAWVARLPGDNGRLAPPPLAVLAPAAVWPTRAGALPARARFAFDEIPEELGAAGRHPI